MAAILHNRQWNNNLIIFSEAAGIFNLRKYAYKLTTHLNFIFKLMHVSCTGSGLWQALKN